LARKLFHRCGGSFGCGAIGATTYHEGKLRAISGSTRRVTSLAPVHRQCRLRGSYRRGTPLDIAYSRLQNTTGLRPLRSLLCICYRHGQGWAIKTPIGLFASSPAAVQAFLLAFWELQLQWQVLNRLRKRERETYPSSSITTRSKSGHSQQGNSRPLGWFFFFLRAAHAFPTTAASRVADKQEGKGSGSLSTLTYSKKVSVRIRKSLLWFSFPCQRAPSPAR